MEFSKWAKGKGKHNVWTYWGSCVVCSSTSAYRRSHLFSDWWPEALKIYLCKSFVTAKWIKKGKAPSRQLWRVQSMGTTATTAGVIPNTAFMPAPLDSTHRSAPCFCQNENSVSLWWAANSGWHSGTLARRWAPFSGLNVTDSVAMSQRSQRKNTAPRCLCCAVRCCLPPYLCQLFSRQEKARTYNSQRGMIYPRFNQTRTNAIPWNHWTEIPTFYTYLPERVIAASNSVKESFNELLNNSPV